MIIRSIPYRDPLVAFESFAHDSQAVLLDGGAVQKDGKNFSYIAADPVCVIEASHRGVTVDGKKLFGDPFAVLERELRKYELTAPEAPTPFAGGAVGYLGYELGGCLEKLPEPRRDKFDLPWMVMGIYDRIAAFDHAQEKAWIIARPDVESARIELFAQKLEQAPSRMAAIDWSMRGVWESELSRSEVEQRIEKIIDYIRAGDIFQANFTQRFHAARLLGLDDFMLYRRLRALSPAPFAAFLRYQKISVASASPERFLRVHRDGVVEAQPIKGTRPRDPDPARDAALADELKSSTKDGAENLMIVDLMRNDLSRVCALGSVRVPDLCKLESFASVHHLVSTVTGQLRPGVGPVDLLRASFPGGSITGAPKIRAMEIIHELEPAPRGVYCGCLGWIGFDQTMDMSMVIRTLTVMEDTILAQAGGGIVADSDPTDEYEESMLKIKPLLRAVTGEAA
jgi:para-aminobenzoate synthetase component 1